MDIKNQKEGLIYFHLNILGIEEILLCKKQRYIEIYIYFGHISEIFYAL